MSILSYMQKREKALASAFCCVVKSCCSVLEWQIVGSTFASRLLCRREGSRSGILGSSVLLWSERRSGLGNRLGNLSANNVVSANIVEPATVVLTSINIELNGDLLSSLYVELLDTVLAKDVEQHFAWVLTRHFDYILLRHPRVARAG